MTLTIDQVNEMIRFALLNTTITSAGGDSPKINTVIDVAGFQSPAFPSEGLSITGESNTEASDTSGGIGVKGGDVGLALRASRGDLTGLLSRAGASLGPAAALAIIPSLIPMIVQELQRPGGLLDKRVRIDAREEAFAVLDRQTRQNTRIGDRQVIIQQLQGFRSSEGQFSTNTSDLIRTNADRVLDIGLFERAQGMSLGGR